MRRPRTRDQGLEKSGRSTRRAHQAACAGSRLKARISRRRSFWPPDDHAAGRSLAFPRSFLGLLTGLASSADAFKFDLAVTGLIVSRCIKTCMHACAGSG
ncbi:hypothetical protein H101_08171 [Trichophyton interdigitale H6]|nr:hypothetical protein H101_08171 [Trichophyton interdigitale H6]